MEYKEFVTLYLAELSVAKTSRNSGRTIKARPVDHKRTEQRQNYYVSLQMMK